MKLFSSFLSSSCLLCVILDLDIFYHSFGTEKIPENSLQNHSVGEPLFLQADRRICKNTLDMQPEEKGDFSDGCINMRVNAQLCKGDSSVMQESERIAAGQSCRKKFADADLTIYG